MFYVILIKLSFYVISFSFILLLRLFYVFILISFLVCDITFPRLYNINVDFSINFISIYV